MTSTPPPPERPTATGNGSPVPDDDPAYEACLALFGSTRSAIPSAFWHILTIARVLESDGTAVNRALAGLWDSIVPKTPPPAGDRTYPRLVLDPHSRLPVYRPIKDSGEAGLLSASDLAMHDLDEVVIRADERQFTIRTLRPRQREQPAPETRPVTDAGRHGRINTAEQKIYLLLDRSWSMLFQNRIHYAKALMIEYLRRVRLKNPMLFFRSFAITLSPLAVTQTASDRERLIEEVLYTIPGEKGTHLQEAIVTAAADIGRHSMLQEAEICVFTDCVDRIDPETIRTALGDRIRLHFIKIGYDSIEPTEKELQELRKRAEGLAVTGREDAAAVLVRQWQAELQDDFRSVSKSFTELPDIELDLAPFENGVIAHMERRVLALEQGINPPGRRRTRLERFQETVFLRTLVEMLAERATAEERPADRRLQPLDRRLLTLEERLVDDPDLINELLSAGNQNLAMRPSVMKRARKLGMTRRLRELARKPGNVHLYVEGVAGRRKAQKSGLSSWRLLLAWLKQFLPGGRTGSG